jgi:cytochrome c-type biogenesis protein CcmH/NrfF
MRILAYAAITVLATSNAFALEDCNRSSAESEINRRLECLQRNNEELASHVAKLSDALKHALRDDGSYQIQVVGGMCLAGDTAGNFLRGCTDVHGAKFRIRP